MRIAGWLTARASLPGPGSCENPREHERRNGRNHSCPVKIGELHVAPLNGPNSAHCSESFALPQNRPIHKQAFSLSLACPANVRLLNVT